jgi:ABC-type amino acid transport substrate-binding protein
MLSLNGIINLITSYASSTSIRPVVLALLLWSTASTAAQTCVLRFALDTPFPPHIILDEAEPHGLNVRMLQALAAEVGCELRLVKSPWARALKLMQQGEIEVISQLSYNPERGKDLYFIGPHHQERMWLIADPTTQPALQQLADLQHWPAGWLLAMLNGGYFGEQFRQLQSDVHFKRHLLPILSNQDKLALLNSGRVQAVLEEELAWRWRVRQQPSPYQLMLLVHDNPVYFGFSRRSVSPQLAASLASGWQRLYQQGQLQQIRQHYLPQQLPAQQPPASLDVKHNMSQAVVALPEPSPYL